MVQHLLTTSSSLFLPIHLASSSRHTLQSTYIILLKPFSTRHACGFTVTRLQFYVYEIARCRRGLNDWVYEKAQKEAAKEKAKKAASGSK